MNSKNYGQKDAGRFEIREGGGCVSVFGLPFFCGGIFLLLAALKVISFQNQNEIPPVAFILMFIMSLPFMGVGGALLLGRRHLWINLAEGRILRESKIFIPVKNETHLIADYKTVSIRFDAGDSDSSGSYPVVLIPSNNGRPLPLYTSMSYADSRECAAEVAQFLKFSLEDAATGHKTLVEPDEVKKSLKDRLASGNEPEKTTRPLLMRSEVIEESGMLRIRIPPPGFKMTLLFPLVISILALAYLFPRVPAILDFFQSSATPKMVQAILFGFAGLFLLLPVFQTVRRVLVALLGDTLLEVGPEALAILERKPWSVNAVRIPVQEIYDVDYESRELLSESVRESVQERSASSARGQEIILSQDYVNTWWFKALRRMVPSKGIILKTKRSFFYFGMGLEDEELRYLSSLVKGKLARG